jgi:ribonuclease HI
MCGWADDTTNNRMEMLAAIYGLKELHEPHSVHLVSDSAYLLNTIENRWYNRWFADEAFFDNAFAKMQGRPTPRPNMDLWRVISTLLDHHEVTTVKVKGHSGDFLNSHVDKLAVHARKTEREYRRELPEGFERYGTLHDLVYRGNAGVLVPEGKMNLGYASS